MSRFDLAAILFVAALLLWVLPTRDSLALAVAVAAFLIAVAPSVRTVEVERSWWQRLIARWRDPF